jgi:hypothetical protein
MSLNYFASKFKYILYMCKILCSIFNNYLNKRLKGQVYAIFIIIQYLRAYYSKSHLAKPYGLYHLIWCLLKISTMKTVYLLLIIREREREREREEIAYCHHIVSKRLEPNFLDLVVAQCCLLNYMILTDEICWNREEHSRETVS